MMVAHQIRCNDGMMMIYHDDYLMMVAHQVICNDDVMMIYCKN